MDKELGAEIEQAIKDGLSNHTGEWFNGFIVPGLKLTEKESEDLLFYLTKAKRLNKNIQALITKENNKARLDELEHAYVGLADIVSTNITGTPESIEERIDSIKRRIVE